MAKPINDVQLQTLINLIRRAQAKAEQFEVTLGNGAEVGALLGGIADELDRS